MIDGNKQWRTVMSVLMLAWMLMLGSQAQAWEKKEFKKVFPEKGAAFMGAYVGQWEHEDTIPEAAAMVIGMGGNKYRVIVTTQLDMRAPIQLDKVFKAKKGKIKIKEGHFYGVISEKDGTFIGGRGDEKTFVMEKTDRLSPYMHRLPPDGADVLYKGEGFDAWQDPTGWVELDNKVMMVTPDGGYLISKKAYTDVTLHVEFRLSYMPKKRGQGRSNSGVFISDEYEIQVLDSFGIGGLYNECGALYKTSAPRVNATFPPLQWQTYDIVFKNAVYDEETKKIINPRITVWHNGVLVHSDEELPWVPGHSAKDRAETHHLKSGHIRLQAHNDFVQYRNVWVKGSVN